MKRRKFTSTFKLKVVLEALKERHTLAELSQKFEITPQQISMWKREFLEGAEEVFTSGKSSPKTEAETERDTLLKTEVLPIFWTAE